MVLRLLLIALGGAAGTLARYGTALTAARWSARLAFPLGTLAVNLIGCFLAGLLAGMFVERVAVREDVRLALLVGFLGGFTTFSAFGLETFALGRDGRAGAALVNVLASNLLGILLVWVGYRVGRG
jgi:fluoride exporter